MRTTWVGPSSDSCGEARFIRLHQRAATLHADDLAERRSVAPLHHHAVTEAYEGRQAGDGQMAGRHGRDDAMHARETWIVAQARDVGRQAIERTHVPVQALWRVGRLKPCRPGS